MASHQQTSVGRYLASRLRDAGCSHVFAVAGDYNLALLDEFNATPGVEMIWTCSELGAGYAADGYARRRGVAAVVVTLAVGGLSALNACAGCYSEDLPVIFICGSVNSNDLAGSTHVLHHTLGSPGFYGRQLRAYSEFTCAQELVQHASRAQQQIDRVISTALKESKPGYIEICCNLPGLKHPSLLERPPPLPSLGLTADERSLAAAVDAAADALRAAKRPLLLAGPRLRRRAAREAFARAAEASGLPVAVTADARGAFPEDHHQMIGIYWGDIGTKGVDRAVATADVVLACGVVGTDYSTLGYTHEIDARRVISVQPGSVSVMGGPTYTSTGDIEVFLSALIGSLEPNPEAVKRLHLDAPPRLPLTAGAPAAAGEAAGGGQRLTVQAVGEEVQGFVDGSHILVAETGESWFTATKIRLPQGSHMEGQMRYGSIGWATGATLGISVAGRAEGKRCVALIGDGAFQMTAVEVSTMLRFGAAPVIILLNNTRYVVEEKIHHGEGYNDLQVWDYAGFARALQNGKGRLSALVASTPGELRTALRVAAAKPDDLVFIECRLDPEDSSQELIIFGKRVSLANSRPPR